MIAITSLMATLVLSLLVTRIGAMALMLTGLSSETARFQARSAFCGVGFTSSETELIMSHPVRRRIIYSLMLLGSIGLATVMATTLASLLQADITSSEFPIRIGFLVIGLSLLWFFSRSRSAERHLNRLISWALRKFSKLEVRDYVSLLNLQSGYSVLEIRLQSKDWLANRSLRELNLTREGILVLGIRRNNGVFLGAPKADTSTAGDDTLVLYGPIDRLAELDHRKAGFRGDQAHQEAVQDHQEELEQVNDPEETSRFGQGMQ